MDQKTAEPIFRRESTLIGLHGHAAVTAETHEEDTQADPQQAEIVSIIMLF